MIVMHGIYENGVVTITDKDIPNIKAEVEIIIQNKPWQRKVNRVKLQTTDLASDILVQMRDE
jgi:hypothetical protein